MRYIDVCSGISAPTMAWKPLGWEALCFAEIEAAPRAVLAHHYPDTPLRGDFTEIRGTEYGPVDLLVGGTPCQSFSVAGLRGGLADDRGNLALEYLRLADRARPRWLVWENVPGVLSSNGGRDFGAILGGMGELGYGFAYRVLDAQHFGVPQRRRRVFVVGYLGDWRRAAAVLFERHSLQGHPAPRREAGQRPAPTIARGSPSGGRTYGLCADTVEGLIPSVSHRLNAGGMGCQDYETETLIAHSLRGEGFDAGEDGTGRGTPLVPHPYTIMERGREGGSNLEYRVDGTANAILTPNGGRGGLGVGAAAFTVSGPSHGFAWEKPYASAVMATPPSDSANTQTGVRIGSAVRRLTPEECEALQGFPRGFTAAPHRGKPMADGPRYKMLGNSMAVPVVRWIGERIERVEALANQRAAA